MLRRRQRRLTPEQIAAQGGNKSLIHIDWMIGSDEIDIDGIHADGSARPGDAQGRVGVIADRSAPGGQPGRRAISA